MVLVGAYGGLRLGDVSLLCWQNIDLANRELRFTSEKKPEESKTIFGKIPSTA
jgi:integrase